MFMHEYLIQSEWELAREIEREYQLDPERAWLRLEHAQSGLDPLVECVVRGIQSVVARIGLALRAQPTLVDRKHAPGTA